MSTTNGTRLTNAEQRIIAAVEQGHRTTRAIAAAAGFISNSNIQRYLHNLATAGHLVLRETAHGLEVDSGLDFARGWDAAARLAGNPDA